MIPVGKAAPDAAKGAPASSATLSESLLELR